MSELEEIKTLLLSQTKTIAELQNQITMSEYIPAWIRILMDKGLIDSDGKTVITDSLEAVAFAIKNQRIIVTSVMLQRFINGKTNKPYSPSAIKKAVEAVNT